MMMGGIESMCETLSVIGVGGAASAEVAQTRTETKDTKRVESCLIVRESINIKHISIFVEQVRKQHSKQNLLPPIAPYT